MGRLMPMECEHGKVYDWGDFGGDDAEPEPCPACDRAWAEHVAEDRVQRLDTAADILRSLGHEHLADHVSEVADEIEPKELP